MRNLSSLSINGKSQSHIKYITLVLLISLAFFSSLPVGALDATRQSSQLIHRNWTRAEGLPAESTWAVHQSEDGYLWIGTEGGLVRFDGSEFEVFNSSTQEAFRADDVRTIVEGEPGTIWAATYGGGLMRIRGMEITRFDKSDGLNHDVVYSTHVADNGDVWAGTAIGACRMQSTRFQCWTSADGLAEGRILRITEGSQGRMWFASIGNGVSSFDGTNFKTYGIEDGLKSPQVFMLNKDPELNVILGTYAGDFHRVGSNGLVPLDFGEIPEGLIPLSAHRDRHDNLWIGMNGGQGLWRMLPDIHQLETSGEILSHVFGLTEDDDGGLWAATSSGLHQFRAGPFMPWGEAEGLTSGTFVVTAAQNDDGVWVGTEGTGLFRVTSEGQVSQLTKEDGLPAASVSSLALDDDGTLWVGTFGGGVALLKNDKIERIINTDDGLAENQITSFMRDQRGAMWIGTAGGLNRWMDNNVTHTFTTENGLMANMIRHIGEDRDGRLLLSSDSGLTRLSVNTLEVIDSFDRSTGLASDVVATTYVDRRGITWIGARSGGLARLDGDTLFRFTPEHQLGIDSIMVIIEDFDGYLWLGGRRGIVRIARSELDAVANGQATRVTSRAFSENDGLRSIRVPGGFKSAATRTRDGKLWFATAKGLAAINPRHLTPINEPLDILIEGVKADGKRIAGGSPFVIPAGTKSVHIDYTVPHLNDADSLEFRYRMQRDGDRWQLAGKRRTAFFTSLPARKHIFEVSVKRKGQAFVDSQYNTKTVAVFVEPLWYQTYLARFLASALLFILAIASYRFALRHYRHKQKRLEQLIGDRTTALRQALEEVKRMSHTDVLTQVANRRHFEIKLKEEWQTAVRHQKPISVMMIDIDYFKQFNDVSGHQAGDECLKSVATALTQSLRSQDFLARFGGEEFVVLMIDSDVPIMRKIAKRLQASVRELHMPHPGRPQGTSVTVSAGFATATPGDIDSPEELLRRADEAMYIAKKQGRDRIVVDGEFPRSA